MRAQKQIEDSEKQAFALKNITTLVPELKPIKFNVKEELARMEEALMAGYQDDENEKPVDLGKLLKIFRKTNVFKTEVVQDSQSPNKQAQESKIVADCTETLKAFNRQKTSKRPTKEFVEQVANDSASSAEKSEKDLTSNIRIESDKELK
jgi:hypothetical protein